MPGGLADARIDEPALFLRPAPAPPAEVVDGTGPVAQPSAAQSLSTVATYAFASNFLKKFPLW